MPSGRFCFEGFLSVNKVSRKEHLDEIKNEKRTLIFYEAPHKLLATLNDLLTALGDRKIAVIKELTKIHETVLKTTLSEAVAYFKDNAPKGEYVLIIDGAKPTEKLTYTLEEATQMAKNLIDGGTSHSAAAKEIAQLTGIKKGDIYAAVLKD